MRIPGLERLRENLPDLRSPRRAAVLGLIGFTAFAAATAAMIAVDRLWPAWTLAGQVGVIVVAALLLGQFFGRRERLQARYGEMAYRHAFVTYVLGGASMMWAAIVHTAYLPGERIVTGRLAVAVLLVGLYLIVTAALLWARAFATFGMDNLAMVYVYRSAEGRMVDSAIYGLIRHPTYSSVVRIGLVLGFWRGTWFSIAFSLLMPVGLTIYLKTVEEPDLVRRFGEGYATYRTRVPAFVPRLQDAGRFWKFLATGG